MKYTRHINLMIQKIMIACMALFICATSNARDHDLPDNLTPEQSQYFKVRQSIRTGRPESYMNQLEELKGYPLFPYLLYQHQLRNPPQEVNRYFEQSKNLKYTPLNAMARHHYLSHLGMYKKWQEFLIVSPNEPKNDSLKCYYYRAQAQVGDPNIAWKGAEKMWRTPHSQEDQCDILFNAWNDAGKRTDQHVWERMLKAFDIKRTRFITYLSRKLKSHEYKNHATTLMALYHNPQQVVKSDFITQKHTSASKDIAYHAIRKMAYSDLNYAVRTLEKYKANNILSNTRSARLHRFLMRRVLIKEDINLRPKLDAYLEVFPNDRMVESRIRWAIHEQNWDDIEVWIGKLSNKNKSSDRWRYWQARILEKKQNYFEAEKIYKDISNKRSFYGFACAEKLQRNFPLNTRTIRPIDKIQRSIKNSDSTKRIKELLALNFKGEARSEWIYYLKRSNKTEKQQLAIYAKAQGWPNFAIEASIQGKVWNALDVRFPLAWDQHFKRYAKKHRVPVSDLQAIARRESAFNRFAKSPVGARGLMQIMPGTARETARKLGIQYKSKNQLLDPQTNVHIGSAYYYQLIKQFDQNRIFALASYNAGPGRVQKWRKLSDGTLDVMSFIETIPYRETREYVQSVLIYRVIYQIFNGNEPQLFSQRELKRLY